MLQATPRHRPNRVNRVNRARQPALTVALHRVAQALSWLLVAAAAALFLLLAVGPHVFGYRTAGMLTGSMAPGIKPGDVIVDTRIDAADVRPGMILTYHIPVGDHRVVSHRVVTVTHLPDGRISFTTKGDANAAPDPWTAISDGQPLWQVRAVIPHLNTIIRQLRATVARPMVVAGAPVLLAGWLIVGIWRDRPERAKSPTGPARHARSGQPDL